MSTTILRGFKVSVAVLDAFLTANGLNETEGRPQYYPHHPDKDEISALLYKKIVSKAEAAAAGGSGSSSTVSIDKNKFRVIMPSVPGMDSFVAYVTYAWFTVYAHRELRMDEDLPAEIPTGFEELRKEILSFADPSRGVPESEKIGDEEGHMGLFVVYTYGYKGEYAPLWVYERNMGPFKCDQCDAVFTGMISWNRRQEHRIEVHGVKESRDPFPEG